ncbi:MAG: asparagine synthase (glutamine-hydrolyzing) [Gammaproteobacteria bacterium]|nr:asparagine synthase (glutamine-hydrolyzing) [Gammaproteobacteria bacterium]
MCGVAGIVSFQSTATPGKHILERMVQQLYHRGPDGYGYFVEAPIGLAHSRLSIIDIAGGDQPIHNEDKSVWVVFNGEIFNYIELRQDLVQQGHVFYTHSDTEVIVHLYEQYGDDFVSYLNGQFAIGLWDKNNQKLILVRDRVGIAPLFYTRQAGQLLFASEVKALMAASEQSPQLNLKALDQLMTFWSPVSPETVFKDVYEVSPGEMVVVKDKQITRKRYWDWQFPVNGDYAVGSDDELACQLHDLLIDATQLRLRSDVPVGAYLSGGLDSSVLVSIIHHYGNVPLRTFSIGFDEQSFDESDHQNNLIKHLNAKHSRIQSSNSDIARDFVKTIYHTESPVLRTAPVPMATLSGLVHNQGYKVVLTGEGADEVLGGYDIFKEAKIRQFWARNSNSAMRPLLLKRLYPYLDMSQGQAYLQQFFGMALDQPGLTYFSHIPRWTTTAKCKDFFSDSTKGVLKGDALEVMNSSFPENLCRWHPFNRAQYIESKSLMAGYLLCSQGDRMLMSHSVEGRFPYLDHRVIEFANRLHPKMKMRALNEKFLLKRAMGKYIPQTIIRRHKQPYRAPDILAFFGENTPAYVDELLSEDKLRSYGYFDHQRVGRFLKKVRMGRAIGYKDNMALVGILSTQVWHYLFVENHGRNVAMN